MILDDLSGEKGQEDFWDCDCKHGYILDRDTGGCPRCDARQDEGTDSRVDEIEAILRRYLQSDRGQKRLEEIRVTDGEELEDYLKTEGNTIFHFVVQDYSFVKEAMQWERGQYE